MAAQRFALDMNAAALGYQAMALSDTRQSANEFLIGQAAAQSTGDNKADQDQLATMLEELSHETQRIRSVLTEKAKDPPH